METNDNLHQGHRERMYDKVLKNADVLADHELLEVLLFAVMPRKDTNAVAHKLLFTFGSIDKIFKATPKELMAIDGIGKRTSVHIAVVGKLFEAFKSQTEEKDNTSWSSFASHKREIAKIFDGAEEETFVAVLLNEKRKKITAIRFEEVDNAKVRVEIPDLAKAIAIHKPKYIVICHNHPSGSPLPSKQDDFTTKKLNLVCEMHGVILVDHVIYGGSDKFYSYHLENRMEEIKKVADLDKIIVSIKE